IAPGPADPPADRTIRTDAATEWPAGSDLVGDLPRAARLERLRAVRDGDEQLRRAAVFGVPRPGKARQCRPGHVQWASNRRHVAAPDPMATGERGAGFQWGDVARPGGAGSCKAAPQTYTSFSTIEPPDGDPALLPLLEAQNV